jgi:REP element-mobilizing transposase RayT
MAQTLTQIYIHVIFSTKNRKNLIAPKIESELFSYFGGISNNNNSKLLAAGGTENHVHLLISIDKNIKLPELIGKIKRDSSKWIKTKEVGNFSWQDGYAAFSVGHTQLDSVKKYIANQKEHHSKIDFEDEFRYFLNKYDVEYDEQYVFD